MASTRRPTGRLFYWLLTMFLISFPILAEAAPATTTISDVVYRADGTPAGGVLLFSWCAFTSGDGAAVGAGTKSVTLGAGGLLSVQLVPTASATPANTLYTVTYQLNDAIAAIEAWKKQVGL
jgi:hypothetical protein